MDWILSTEFFSLIIVFILILNLREKKSVTTPGKKMYQNCLCLSAVNIILNIICVFTIEYYKTVPIWINMALNSLYFFLIVCMSTYVAYYMAYLILEHVYDKYLMKKAVKFLTIITVIYSLLIIININAGFIFYFDSYGYHRGSLLNIGYGVMALEIAMLVYFCVKNKMSITKNMVHVMKMMPPIVILLTIFQLIYDEVLMNGCIIVVADILLLFSFQSGDLEIDSLTSIGNRSSFYNDINLRISGRQSFQLIIISIKKFSAINQKFGHKIGDMFLYEIAKKLEKIVPEAKAFRYGNVDFAVVVPFDKNADADNVLDTILSRFEKPWNVGSSKYVFEAKFAEVIYHNENIDITQFMEYAEYSLGLTNECYGNVVRFDKNICDKYIREKAVLNFIREGIDKNRFFVYYQPIYDCKNNSFSSAEALLRLKDDKGNIISPCEFIPLAEENGYLDQISWIVIDKVCSFLSDIKSHYLGTVSVNLTMQQFLSNDFVDRMTSCLKKYNVDPKRLKIEITESAIVQDLSMLSSIMKKLSLIGVKFYLDDFGTGYSNLSTVLDLDFEYIKIDHSLLNGFPENIKTVNLLKTMIDVFQNMGSDVVVEGIETKKQAEEIINIGADWIQGFYYSNPLPENEFVEFIEKNNEAV